jgi:hypothetical protein
MQIRFIVFQAVILIAIIGQAQDRSIAKQAGLEKLLRDAEIDTLLKFERKCAMEFHAQINNYRKRKGIEALEWSDALWLAARNHCDYMHVNGVFAHEESAGKPLFTGINPSDRAGYVSNKRNSAGENIAQTWIQKWDAGEIAAQAFDLWKKSQGHNENMLNKSYKAHGTAVRINTETGMVMLADVLSFTYPEQAPQILASNAMVSETNYAYEYKKPKEVGEKALSTSVIRKDLGNAFYYAKVQEHVNNAGKRNAELAKKTAKRNAEFLSSFMKNRELIKEMKTQNWYTLSNFEAVPGNFFQHISGNYKNRFTTVIVAFKPEKYSISELSKFVFEAWNEHLLPNAEKYACHVALKRKGEHFIVCASFEQAG